MEGCPCQLYVRTIKLKHKIRKVASELNPPFSFFNLQKGENVDGEDMNRFSLAQMNDLMENNFCNNITCKPKKHQKDFPYQNPSSEYRMRRTFHISDTNYPKHCPFKTVSNHSCVSYCLKLSPTSP